MPNQTEGDDRFAAGPAGNPAVGIRPGKGLIGAHVKKEGFVPLFQGMHLLEFPGIFNRGQPCFQKVRTKGKEKVGLFHTVGGQTLYPEDRFIGGFKGLIGVGFKDQGGG